MLGLGLEFPKIRGTFLGVHRGIYRVMEGLYKVLGLGLPKVRGTILGGCNNEGSNSLGYVLGSSYLWKLHLLPGLRWFLAGLVLIVIGLGLYHGWLEKLYPGGIRGQGLRSSLLPGK